MPDFKLSRDELSQCLDEKTAESGEGDLLDGICPSESIMSKTKCGNDVCCWRHLLLEVSHLKLRPWALVVINNPMTLSVRVCTIQVIILS